MLLWPLQRHAPINVDNKEDGEPSAGLKLKHDKAYQDYYALLCASLQ